MTNLLGLIPWRQIPWRRLMLIAAGALVSYLLIPIIVSRYNDIKSLREARIERAIKFGDRDDELSSKVNALETLMGFFADHNDRGKISGTQLIEVRKELYKNYRERYLDLDAMAWWWPSDFRRETDALNLLAPDEIRQLNTYIHDYKESVKTTMNQPKLLFEFVDSPRYKVDKQGKKDFEDLKAKTIQEFQAQREIRNGFVQKISALFVRSNFRTNWLDMIGL
jgi:hypothetical protein